MTIQQIEEGFDKYWEKAIRSDEFRFSGCHEELSKPEKRIVFSFYRQKIAELVKECVSKYGCSGDTYDKEIHCGCREAIIENFKQAGIELTDNQ